MNTKHRGIGLSAAFFTLALAAAGLLLSGCGQSPASPIAPSPDASAGSGGLEINVPSQTPIDCDAAAPVENLAPMPGDPLCDPSAAAASFTKDVVPIVGSCSGEVCHVPWTYHALVGVHSMFCCDKRFLVDPYLPSSSALIQALLGTNPCVGQMPPGRPYARKELDPVIAWVCQGAPND